MYRSGTPKYLGSSLGADEDSFNPAPPDVDCIAAAHFMPAMRAPQRIANYDTALAERQQRVNGLGAVSRGVGRPSDWMEVSNQVKLRMDRGRPAIRQRFLDGLGADAAPASPISVASNKPYMVVSDPNAPFVLYAQNAESAPYQPFALFRQYRPAQETSRAAQSRAGFPSQWGYVDGLGAYPIAAPFVFTMKMPTTLVRDNTPANTPVVAAPSKRIASSFGVRNALTNAISARKAVIEAGYKIGTNVGLKIPVGKTRTPQMPTVAVKSTGSMNDALMQRSLFVEY